MNNQETLPSENRYVLAVTLIIILVWICYGTTLNNAWHFDDFPGIIENPNIHMESISLDSVYHAMFKSKGGESTSKLYRPVSNISLALNWYWGRGRVQGYHLVNIILHILTAISLYSLIRCLAMTPMLRLRIRNDLLSPQIALLAAAMWAIHPINTQAVTMVIQRMAVLAALFNTLGMLCYLKARQSNLPHRRMQWWVLTILCYLAGIGSKENAVMLPAALVLVEILFFQGWKINDLSGRVFFRLFIGAILFSLLGFILMTLFVGDDPITAIAKGYGRRPFSMIERVLTEPRIIFLYISQLFYFHPKRFSLLHDVNVSTGLSAPWTTLPALSGIFALFFLGIYLVRKQPILSFAILFYLINHIVESTIIPLELIYEHRNYLPSMFIFWFIAILFGHALDFSLKRNRVLGAVVGGGIVLVLTSLGDATYARNQVWATEGSLWSDTLAKAPNSARSYLNYAIYKEQQGDYRRSLVLYNKSLTKNSPWPKETRAVAYTNMGGIFFRFGQYEKAVELYRQAVKMRPEGIKERYNYALALIFAGRLDQALDAIETTIKSGLKDGRIYYLQGVVQIRQKQTDKALQSLRDALKAGFHDMDTYKLIGIAMGMKGFYSRGEWFLNIADKKKPGNLAVGLSTLELMIQAKELEKAKKITKKILENHSWHQVQVKIYEPVSDIIRPLQIESFMRKQLIHELTLQNK